MVVLEIMNWNVLDKSKPYSNAFTKDGPIKLGAQWFIRIEDDIDLMTLIQECKNISIQYIGNRYVVLVRDLETQV